MPQILIAECKQEVSSFNPVASHYDDFIVLRGQAVLDYHRRKGMDLATMERWLGPNLNYDPLT